MPQEGPNVKVTFGVPEPAAEDACVPNPDVPGYGFQHTAGETCSTCHYVEAFETKAKKRRGSSPFGRRAKKKRQLGPPPPKLVVVYDCTLYGVEVGKHCTCDSWE